MAHGFEREAIRFIILIHRQFLVIDPGRIKKRRTAANVFGAAQIKMLGIQDDIFEYVQNARSRFHRVLEAGDNLNNVFMVENKVLTADDTLTDHI